MVSENHNDDRGWRELLNLLERYVPAGRVTTFANLAQRLHGNPSTMLPINASLRKCTLEGYDEITCRVVHHDGTLVPDRPAGDRIQREVLENEGVPLIITDKEVRVDFEQCPPVTAESMSEAD